MPKLLKSASPIVQASCRLEDSAGPGSGTVAIDPSISSGAGGSTSSARHRRSRPARARSRFAAISSGQPPGSSEPMNRIAVGSARYADRVGGARSSRTRAETVSGRYVASSRRGRSPAAGSPSGDRDGRGGRPIPSARTATCDSCRCSRRRRSRRGRAGPCPARGRRRRACRCRARPSSCTSSAIGKTSAVGLVTWLISASLVRGVTHPRIASVTCPASRIGKGISATTTRRPATVRGERCRIARGVVLVVVDEDLVAGLEAAATAGRC